MGIGESRRGLNCGSSESDVAERHVRRAIAARAWWKPVEHERREQPERLCHIVDDNADDGDQDKHNRYVVAISVAAFRVGVEFRLSNYHADTIKSSASRRRFPR